MIFWAILAILAALCWASANVIDKYVLIKQKPIITMIFTGFVSLIAVIIVFFIFGFSKLSYPGVLISLLGGAFYTLATYLYCKAFQKSEVSRILPVFNINSLFIVIIAALFLNEILMPIKYLGAVFLIIGAVLISYKKETKFILDVGVWLAIFSSLGYAIDAILMKVALSYSDFITVTSMERLGSFLVLIPFIFIYSKDLKLFLKQKKPMFLVTSSEIFTIIGLFLITLAASTNYVSLVRILSSTQSFFVLLFTFILSTFFPKILKEDMSKKTLSIKIIAIVLLFIGVIIVSL